MPGIGDVADVWKNLKQVDLRPIEREANEPVRLALVGRRDAGLAALADGLRTDPYRPEQRSTTPLIIVDPSLGAQAGALADVHLVLVLVPASPTDLSPEGGLLGRDRGAGSRVVTLLHRPAGSTAPDLGAASGWHSDRVITGDTTNVRWLEEHLVPAVLDLLPEEGLSLARQLPLFRATVTRRLVEETSLSNATYALSTGLAGLIPILNIPLNVADMVVLTKAQAFLVYRIGLALGLSTRWQDYVREFGSVIGGGFLWRQLARTLVGLLPGLGVVPKVAVAYAGTFVVGNVVWNWYLTGRHLSAEQMKALYRRALESGAALARDLATRVPRRRRRARDIGAERVPRYCRACGASLDPGAAVCARCGTPVAAPAPSGGRRSRRPGWLHWPAWLRRRRRAR